MLRLVQTHKFLLVAGATAGLFGGDSLARHLSRPVAIPAAIPGCCLYLNKYDQQTPTSLSHGMIKITNVAKTPTDGACDWKNGDHCYYCENWDNDTCKLTVQATITNNAPANVGSIMVTYGYYKGKAGTPKGSKRVFWGGGSATISATCIKYCNGNWQSPSDWGGAIISWYWAYTGVFSSDIIDTSFNCHPPCHPGWATGICDQSSTRPPN